MWFTVKFLFFYKNVIIIQRVKYIQPYIIKSDLGGEFLP